jgi:hypothetical protein
VEEHRVDRAFADDDVALVEPPSTSGAHWANRDQDGIYRRPDGQAPFRRPPAVNSLQEPASFPPESTEAPADRGWFDAPASYGDDEAGRGPTEPQRPAPPFGPAPPASSGRTAFGVTAGPISTSGRAGVAASSTALGSSAVPSAASIGKAGTAIPMGAATPMDATPMRPANQAMDATPMRPAAPPASADAAPTSPAGAPVSPARVRPVPEFGEFLVGPSREIRPHRAARRPPPEPVPHWSPQQAQPARRSRAVMIAAIALTAIVLVAGATAGILLFSGSDRSIDSVLRLGDGAGERTVTAALGGRTSASFELLAATTKVTVKAQDLRGDLYRITSAAGSGTVPSPVLAKNRLQLHLTPRGAGATGKVTVVLSSRVKWTLRFVGGADEQVVDLRGGRVGSVEVLGAARRFELALPAPAGTVPVRLTGAVEDLSITAPADSPVRVRLDSGAKTVAAGERTLRDVQPGSTVTPADWQTRNRYDVHAESRISLLSVTAA